MSFRNCKRYLQFKTYIYKYNTGKRIFHKRKRIYIPQTMLKSSLTRKVSSNFLIRLYSNGRAVSAFEHPFFSLSEMDQFTLCYSERRRSLANGEPIFPIFVEDMKSMKKILCLQAVKFSNSREIMKWLHDYTRMTKIVLPTRTKLISMESLTFTIPSQSFLTKEKYPQLNEIIELLTGEQDLNKVDPIALNSLLDYILLNDRSGLFVENIYLFLLQNYAYSLDKLMLILGSIKLHLNSKLDYFPDVETIVSQVLLTITLLPEDIQMEPFDDIFQDLLQKVTVGANLEVKLSKFNNTILSQLLKYHLTRCPNLFQCKIVFSILLSRKVRPSNDLIHRYLQILEERTKNLHFMESKLQKLIYLSDFRALIKQSPSIELIQFIIPLCQSGSELQSVLTIISKQDNNIQYFDKVTEQLLDQYQLLLTKDKSSCVSISMIDLFNVLSEAYEGKIPEKHLKNIMYLLLSEGNYSMVTKIILGNESLWESDTIKEITIKIPQEDSPAKKKFIQFLKTK